MNDRAYRIASATTEDRFGETDTLGEAVEIARNLATQEWVGGPVAIEHDGLVVHQFVLTPDGVVDEIAADARLMHGNAAGG